MTLEERIKYQAEYDELDVQVRALERLMDTPAYDALDMETKIMYRDRLVKFRSARYLALCLVLGQ